MTRRTLDEETRTIFSLGFTSSGDRILERLLISLDHWFLSGKSVNLIISLLLSVPALETP